MARSHFLSYCVLFTSVLDLTDFFPKKGEHADFSQNVIVRSSRGYYS